MRLFALFDMELLSIWWGMEFLFPMPISIHVMVASMSALLKYVNLLIIFMLMGVHFDIWVKGVKKSRSIDDEITISACMHWAFLGFL